MALDIARAFGKSTAFAVLGMMLTPIGYLMLGFGKATYKGSSPMPLTTPDAPAATPPPAQPPVAPQA